VIGAKAMSSSLVTPLVPFGVVTPTTWKLTPLIWIVSPTGSAPSNRFVTTVGPSTTTRSCFFTCAEVKKSPA